MTIPVFYSISDDFAKYVAVSLNSLVKGANLQKDYTATSLNQDLPEKHQRQLATFADDHVHAKFFHIDEKLVKPIQNRKENYLQADFFTMFTFYRLLIPDLFPQYDKTIYTDSDTIVIDDIVKLYNNDLGNNLFAACTDSSIQYVDKTVKCIKEVLALDPKKYTNSGMLVLNSKAFRDEHLIDHFMHLLEQYHFGCIAPDQNYLNETGDGKILHLDPRWDAIPNENTVPIPEPGLIHYNLLLKPWHFRDVQYNDYFWKYASSTSFYEELKSELDNYTNQERAEDRAELDHMLEKEASTALDPNNWTQIKKKGERMKL